MESVWHLNEIDVVNLHHWAAGGCCLVVLRLDMLSSVHGSDGASGPSTSK